MSEKLLPCPFCGEDAYFERHGTHRQSCIVACQSCSCSLETGETGHDCGGMWNQRAAQPAAIDADFVADLERSRAKYPGNARMFDGLLGELGELQRAYAGDGDIRAEAFDVAVCAYRIATEGDTGGNTLLAQPAASVDLMDALAAMAARRDEETLLMKQADKDRRVFNAQGHQQAADAINFCLSKLTAAPVAAQPSVLPRYQRLDDWTPSGIESLCISLDIQQEQTGGGSKACAVAASMLRGIAERYFSAPTPPADDQAQQDAYEAGWRTAAVWADRGDLVSDIGSAAYERDKAEALRLAQQGGQS